MQIIRLPRRLSIKKAGELCTAALQVLEKGPECTLDFSRVDRIDLSIGQIILALGRECGRRGGRLEIRNTNEVAARQLRLAGVALEGAHTL